MDALAFSITSHSEKKCAVFAQFWEAKLPAYPLIINEMAQNCAVIKNCAVWEAAEGRMGMYIQRAVIRLLLYLPA